MTVASISKSPQAASSTPGEPPQTKNTTPRSGHRTPAFRAMSFATQRSLDSPIPKSDALAWPPGATSMRGSSLRPLAGANAGISRYRKRERSGRSGSRSLSPGPRPLRTARASFPACRSSRLTCLRRPLGRSQSAALAVRSACCPVDLVPGRARRATVVRCRWWPYRSDRVSHGLSSFSSYSTRGKSAPFQVVSPPTRGGPIPPITGGPSLPPTSSTPWVLACLTAG